MRTPLARSAAKLAISLPLCALLAHIVLPATATITPRAAVALIALAPAAIYTCFYSALTLWLLLEKLFGQDRFS
jgi:hypothetical protein